MKNQKEKYRTFFYKISFDMTFVLPLILSLLFLVLQNVSEREYQLLWPNIIIIAKNTWINAHGSWYERDNC